MAISRTVGDGDIRVVAEDFCGRRAHNIAADRRNASTVVYSRTAHYIWRRREKLSYCFGEDILKCLLKINYSLLLFHDIFGRSKGEFCNSAQLCNASCRNGEI